MQFSKTFVKGFLPPLLCLLAMMLAACNGGTTTSNTTKASIDKQILILPDGGIPDIKTFDPALASDLSSINAIDMVFTGLVQLNDKLEVTDELAASHSVSSDGMTWTFKLRPNLKFSDGTALTSADVAYSIDRALSQSLKSTVSPAYLNLVKDSDKRLGGQVTSLIGDSLLVTDPNTIVIKTSKPAAYFLDALSYSCSYVVEKSMIQKYGNNFADHLSTSGVEGPFMVSNYIHNKEIDFVPNPNYYGPKPQLKKVIIPFYKDADTVFSAYLANQVSEAGVPAAKIAQAKALPGHQFYSIPQLWINYYAMNYLSKPFDNLKIRQAFALAIDKNEIAHNVHKDGTFATNHIVPQGMPGYFPDLTGPAGVKSTRGDSVLAKKLLQEGMKEEGYTPSTFPSITITVSTVGAEVIREEIAVLQQRWQNVLGVNVKFDDIDFNKLLDDITGTQNNGNLQAYRIDWIADYPDPQDFLTLQFDKDQQNNTQNYGQNHTSDTAQQQATQQLLEQADVNLNSAERMKQYNQAEQQLVNDVVWVPISQQLVTFARKSCVVGRVDNAEDLTPPWDWANVYISTNSNCANTSQYQ